jgi:hypothetical protein
MKMRILMGLCTWLAINVSAELLLYEGFDYGTVTNFEHNIANAGAADGHGFSAAGWRQYNIKVPAAGLVETSTGLYSPPGLAATDGYMKISGGGSGNTWALRRLSSSYPMHADGTYYFSVVLKDEDTDTSHSADGAKLVLRSGKGATIAFVGFSDMEALIAACGTSPQVNGRSIIRRGGVVTLIGKLVLSASGPDTLYASAFTGSVPAQEPSSWDLSTSAELAYATLAEIGLNVNGGNSEVDFDEVRLGTTFMNVVPVQTGK